LPKVDKTVTARQRLY